MERAGPSTALLAGVAVLERAIAYTLGSLALVEPAMLGRPTPCSCWDLHDLLIHMSDSMAALQEAAETGRVDLDPPPGTGVIPLVRERPSGCWARGRTPATRAACGSPRPRCPRRWWPAPARSR